MQGGIGNKQYSIYFIARNIVVNITGTNLYSYQNAETVLCLKNLHKK